MLAMALDGILLHKIVENMACAIPSRIQKIYQISQNEVLFQLHNSTAGKSQLLVSCHSQYNRMLLTKRSYPTPNEPGNFVMVLRKYLEGATIESLQQIELDRWCDFKIKRHNDLGDAEELHLYVELMGKYANIILVRDGIIIDALKRIPPFENNRRTIQVGAKFTPTPSQNKKDPFARQYIDPDKNLTAQFAGFSPMLSNEVEYRMRHGQSFSSIMKEIEDSNELFIANNSNDAIFHCIAITSCDKSISYPLFEGFDILYFHKEEKERIKEISGDIFHTVKKELKHETQKLPRLLKEYDDALDCNKWNKYGELLYAYNIQDTKGTKEIKLEDYETGKEITIPLDPKLDGKGNAKKCYQKYTKLKKGQKYLSEQIALCKQEIEYFEGLLEQIEIADFNTASEVKEELIKGGYMKEKRPQKKKNKNKKTKEKEIHFTTIETISCIQISFGKNNLQNDELTWHHAKKSEIWLHAKDYHGAHVVIHHHEIDEDTLRLAANIAAYFSKGRDSSSVPVNYCPVKELKKIPGAKPGMVQLGSYKTIYIDPSVDELEANHIKVD